MRYLLGFVFLLSATLTFAQKPFEGKMTYTASIMMPDTNIVYRTWDVNVYTNDTIVRVETEGGQFGTQVYIRHMQLNKAYLLLDIEGQRFAIQTDLNKTADTAKVTYTTKKLFGSKKINGLKCKKYRIVDEGNEGFISYFAKQYSNKYLEVYKDIPGLAVDYYLPSNDGLIHYEMKSMTAQKVNRDLFGIPSDYQKVTFDEFLHMMMGESEGEE